MIVTDHLTKDYHSLRAVDGLTLRIAPGEIFGLLGPNGAGKTTAVRMLNTLTRPSSGRAWINGMDIARGNIQVKRIIGVCPQEVNLDRDLTGRQNLRIHGLLHGMKDIAARTEELLAWAGLSDRGNNMVGRYSGGMQRRLSIARSIMHCPKVLFLDEPTVGLDPQTRRGIWDLIRDMNRNGTTILLTTHYIEEAELLCHRVGILSHGKLIILGTPEELKEGRDRVVAEAQVEDVTRYELFESKEQAHRFASGQKGQVLIRDISLEDVFIKLTGEKIDL